MLSNQEIKVLGRVARISLGEDETESLCRNLNALLEMASVLEDLPVDHRDLKRAVNLQDLREDQVITDQSPADTGKGFSVPPVMEKI